MLRQELVLSPPDGEAEEVPPAVLVDHGEAGGVVEILLVQPEGSVGPDIDEPTPDQCGIALDPIGPGIAVRGKPHQLVLAGVDPEAQEVGEGRVQEADRVREVQLAEDGQPVLMPVANRSGRPFPHPIDGHHRRLGEGRRIEGARRVGKMVLGEEKPGPLAIKALDTAELLQDEPLEQQLLLDPDRHGGEEGPEAPRSEGVVRLEQALELEEGLVVEDHRVQLVE